LLHEKLSQLTITPSFDAVKLKVFRDKLKTREKRYAGKMKTDENNFIYWSARRQEILLVVHDLEELLK